MLNRKKIDLFEGETEYASTFSIEKPFKLESDTVGEIKFDLRWVNDFGRTYASKTLTKLLKIQFHRDLQSAAQLVRDLKGFYANISLEQEKLSYSDFFNHFNGESTPRYERLVSFFKRWLDISPDYFSETLTTLLKNGILNQKSKKPYKALRTNDQKKGAFTDEEYNLISKEIEEYFSRPDKDLRIHTIIEMFMSLGVRAIQLVRMYGKDVIVINEEKVEVSIPYAKQRSQVQKYAKRILPPELSKLIIKYLTKYHIKNDDKLFAETSDELRNIVHKLFNNLKIISPRTSNDLDIFISRFRYTVGTKAIRLGYSQSTLREILMHKSNSAYRHYLSATTGLFEHMGGAMEEPMDFIFNSFRGTLINDIKDSNRFKDFTAFIMDYSLATNPDLLNMHLGMCSSSNECFKEKPIACLTCKYFHALPKADWGAMSSKLREMNLEEDDPELTNNINMQLKAIEEIRDLIEANEC